MTGAAETMGAIALGVQVPTRSLRWAHVGDSGADRACRPLNNEPLGS